MDMLRFNADILRLSFAQFTICQFHKSQSNAKVNLRKLHNKDNCESIITPCLCGSLCPEILIKLNVGIRFVAYSGRMTALEQSPLN